jgi:1-acyl-sn-glycerol-3-phosphate acyltransferase
MRYVVKPLQWIYCLWAFAWFVTLMLILFPFVLMASFLGRIRGGNAIFTICMLWADLWFPLVLVFPKKIYEAPHDKTKPYIFVANHTSLLDAALLPKAFRQALRPLGKVEMSKIPVFGYIYRKAIVTVDRSNVVDRAHSVRILKSIIGKNISVLFFPEGTYNQTDQPLKEFYSGAFRVAIETQTAIKPVLFLDAYDRLRYHHALTFNPGRCRIVFLDAIPVVSLELKDAEALKATVFKIMEGKLREYNVDWAPPAPKGE